MMPAISPRHRYPSGQPVHAERKPREETPEQARSVVVGQRIKHFGATPETARDQRWAHPVGRMRMWAVQGGGNEFGLSNVQAIALVMYLTDFTRAHRLKALPRLTLQALSYESGSRGASVALEPDKKDIEQADADARDARASLMHSNPVNGALWVKLLRELAGQEHDDRYWLSALGELRMAANVLARHYGLWKTR